MLTSVSVFPLFFPHWEHVASIVFLAGFSHFNPSCEHREKGKERWECQRGSRQQLRVINHCHGERQRMKDMREAVQQTWQQPFARDEMNQPTNIHWRSFVGDMRLLHHILLGTQGISGVGEAGESVKMGGSDQQTKLPVWQLPKASNIIRRQQYHEHVLYSTCKVSSSETSLMYRQKVTDTLISVCLPSKYLENHYFTLCRSIAMDPRTCSAEFGRICTRYMFSKNVLH